MYKLYNQADHIYMYNICNKAFQINFLPHTGICTMASQIMLCPDICPTSDILFLALGTRVLFPTNTKIDFQYKILFTAFPWILPVGTINYSARMHRGKVIGLSVCLSVVTTKITRSWHLGTWSIHKHNESVEVGENLASVCLESSGTAYKRHK